MIVQTAKEGAPNKVIPMSAHLDLVAQFGRGFGNADFATLCPRELMEFAIANHDAGWKSVDEELGIDPETDLPRNLLRTPLEELVKTGPGSAAFNEAHHPFCGLLVSMHACGLLNGRYGLSDKIVVDVLPESAQPMFQDMLDQEAKRQDRLKASLAADPATCEWVEERMLFHNYKLLQFFDTLGLYFCMEHGSERKESSFLNVPRSVENDVTIKVTPINESTYRVNPFPFADNPFEISLPGTFVEADASVTTASAALKKGVSATERIVLVP